MSAALLDAKPTFTLRLISRVGRGASAVVDARHAFERRLKRKGIEVTGGNVTVAAGVVKSIDVTVKMFDSFAVRATVCDLAKQSGLEVVKFEADLKS
jgi:hypothetical protein